jgi:hypothetical protein
MHPDRCHRREGGEKLVVRARRALTAGDCRIVIPLTPPIVGSGTPVLPVAGAVGAAGSREHDAPPPLLSARPRGNERRGEDEGQQAEGSTREGGVGSRGGGGRCKGGRGGGSAGS